MNDKREVWVDYAKGIGIILVVYGHVLVGLLRANFFPEPAAHQLVFSIIYTFHMPLFFFLAGLYFESSFKRRGASLLLANKIDTIVYPYLVWSILQYSIQVFLSDHTNSKIGFEKIPYLILMSGSQFWFLHTLFFIFLICIVTRHFFSEKSLFLVLIIFFLIYINQESLSEWISPSRFYNSGIFFIAGVFFNKIKNDININGDLPISILTMAFIFGQYWFHYVLGYSCVSIGVEFIFLAMVSIIFVCGISMKIMPGSLQWLRYLGEHSMIIYLMNILGTAGARIILGDFMNIKIPEVHLLIGLLTGIVGPVIFYKLAKSAHAEWLFSPAKKISVERLMKGRNQKMVN